MGFMNTANKKLQTTYNAKSEGSVGDSLFVRTSIDVIDYYLGTEINSEDGDFYNLGIPQGKIVKFIGHSQSGKTTLALQIADATVKELNGDVVVFDFERSSSDMRSRYKAITGCTDEEYDERFTLFKNPTMSVDDVKEYIFTIAKQKQEAGKKCMVEWVNLEGTTNKIYPPTVIIIDSWAVVRNKEILNDAKLDGNMVAASIAKSNGAFLTSIEHLLEEYNISLFIINHITTKISINPYAAKKIQLPGLGDDENLPGETRP